MGSSLFSPGSTGSEAAGSFAEGFSDGYSGSRKLTFASFSTQTLSGRGDDVVRVNKPDGPAIVKISTTGNESNFAVWNVDGSGESIDLLVNEIGNYAGVRAIDFRSDEKTSRFEVTADGSWKIEVKPVSSARKASVPGSVSGHGDEVMVLSGSSPDTAAIEHSGESNFAVTSYDTLGADLLVNEIGPYSGTIAMRNADVLEIKADGEWSIDFR